jgi:hypothetical protein
MEPLQTRHEPPRRDEPFRILDPRRDRDVPPCAKVLNQASQKRIVSWVRGWHRTLRHHGEPFACTSSIEFLDEAERQPPRGRLSLTIMAERPSYLAGDFVDGPLASHSLTPSRRQAMGPWLFSLSISQRAPFKSSSERPGDPPKLLSNSGIFMCKHTVDVEHHV